MIYDLSHPINEQLRVYPGDPHVSITQAASLEIEGYADRLLTMGTHNGTHMDAPAHMLPGGKQLKDYPASRFVVDAVCIDVRGGFEAIDLDTIITSVGMAALFFTSASDRFEQESYWHSYPVLPETLVQKLIEKQVSMVGIDSGSFDSEVGFPVHKALLGADILLLENLTALQPLAGQNFRLYALPLKLEADGAPARVLAEL